MRSLYYRQLLTDAGLMFYTREDGLSSSYPLTVKELDKIPVRKYNYDNIPMLVKCTKCGKYMDFKPGPKENRDGYWICPKCKRKTVEKLAYDVIASEIMEHKRKAGVL